MCEYATKNGAGEYVTRLPLGAPLGARVAATENDSKVLQTRNFCLRREITQDFPFEYHREIGGLRDKWAARAERLQKAALANPERHEELVPKARYAAARARTLSMEPQERLELCGARRMVVRCGCRYVAVPVGCGFRGACPQCAAKESKRRRRKLSRAMRAHQSARYRGWVARGKPKGGQSRWLLATLSVRHSGDVAADRRRILHGWQGLRKWLHYKLHHAVPFALVWEATPGTDGHGHVHAHVAVLAPWFDWTEAHEVWRRVCPSSEQLNFAAAKGGKGAARYLAKYVSKTVDVADFGAKLAARLIVSQYGQRMVTTSHKFWVRRPIDRRCATCGDEWQMEQRPNSLASLVPLRIAELGFGSVRFLRGGPGAIQYRFDF